MEEAITSLLLSSPAVATIAGDRVNWSARPDDFELPALTLHRVSGRRDRTLEGRTGLVSSTVQIDCWGLSFKDAKLLSRAVVPALPHGRTVAAGTVLEGIFIESESDTVDRTDPQQPLFHTRIDISVWHQEANT